MKKLKNLAVLAVLVLVFSCVCSIVFGAEETPFYQYTYDNAEDSNQVLEAGTTYKKLNTSGTTAWYLNNAGSYANVWLVNDNKSLDGNYMAVYAPANQPQWLFTKDAVTAVSTDFSIDFNFNSLSCGPGGSSQNRGLSKFAFCIYPAASFAANTNPRDINYSIFSHSSGIFLGLDGTDISGFETALDTWYDLKVQFSFSTAVPTYSVLIKPSGDSSYTTLIDHCSLPEDWNYSQGLKTGGILYRYGDASILATDNVKISNITGYGVTLIAGDHGALSFDSENLTGTYGVAAPGADVTVNITPEEGYEIDEIVLNGALQPVAGNQISFEVNRDSTLSVTFQEIPEIPIELTSGGIQTYEQFSYTNKNGETVNMPRQNIVQYFKVNNYSDGKTYTCGINLKKTDTNQSLKLPASSEIAPNGCYGIRVYGDAVEEMIQNNTWDIELYQEEAGQ